MMIRSFAVPVLLCAILIGTVTAVTGIGWGFRGVERSLPMPSAITVADGQAAAGKSVTFSTRFNASADANGASLDAAGPAGFKVLLDGVTLAQAGDASPSVVRTSVKEIQAGAHTLSLVAVSPGQAPVVGCSLDIVFVNGERSRVATDQSWQVTLGSESATRTATVCGDHTSVALAGAFASLPSTYAERKEPVFWATYLCLIGSMVIACFAGPVLRPQHLSQGVGPAVGLASVLPSTLYAASAFVITGLAGVGLTVSWILILHVLALSGFMLALAAIGIGGKLVDRDHVALKAELAGYDAMMARADLVVATMQGLPVSAKGAWMSKVESMAERIRFSATTTHSPDIDRAILAEIDSLDRAISSSGSPDEAKCCELVQRVEALLLRREAVASASRRAPA